MALPTHAHFSDHCLIDPVAEVQSHVAGYHLTQIVSAVIHRQHDPVEFQAAVERSPNTINRSGEDG